MAPLEFNFITLSQDRDLLFAQGVDLFLNSRQVLGLHMKDKDGVIFILQLFQLSGHGLGGEMTAEGRQLLELVGERTFNKDGQQII